MFLNLTGNWGRNSHMLRAHIPTAFLTLTCAHTAHALSRGLEPRPGPTMSPLFYELSLAAGKAGVLTISRLRLSLCGVCVWASEACDEEREGTCTKCMVITVQEVMESGHFYGSSDLPPEPFQSERAFWLPLRCACFTQEMYREVVQWKTCFEIWKQTRMYLKTKQHNALNSCCRPEIFMWSCCGGSVFERDRSGLASLTCPVRSEASG